MQCTPEIHTGRLEIHAMYPGDTYRQVGDTCNVPRRYIQAGWRYILYTIGVSRKVVPRMEIVQQSVGVTEKVAPTLA